MKRILSAITICILFTMKAYSFTQIVTVQNHVFTPSNFTINLGDTIKWTWLNGSHTTTSLTIPAGAATWDHPINSSSTSFTYVPSKPGAYNYKCTPHFAMGMQGSFTVVCAQATVQISAGGPTTFCKGGSVLLNSNNTSKISSYQWKKNGTNIANATASTYKATVAGSYTLTVTNNCGNTANSNAISVTVNALPTAVITPADSVAICRGDSIKLQANKNAAFTYQWQKNGVNIQGATSNNYTTKTGGNYRVIVTRTATGCSKTSLLTKVKLQCPGFAQTNQVESLIKVFPNPSTNNFHVSIPYLNNQQYVVTIYDNKGNAVGNKKIFSDNFSFGDDLKSGIYLIQIKSNNAIIFEQKIIKE
ncbi:MAG: T9SS type A sorting domain-containing protein [Parafilimonas sp.]